MVTTPPPAVGPLAGAMVLTLGVLRVGTCGCERRARAAALTHE